MILVNCITPKPLVPLELWDFGTLGLWNSGTLGPLEDRQLRVGPLWLHVKAGLSFAFLHLQSRTPDLRCSCIGDKKEGNPARARLSSRENVTKVRYPEYITGFFRS